jgi:peptide-methionine (S)-S-oxide reductase
MTGAHQAGPVRESMRAYQRALNAAGKGQISTEIRPLDVFYPAEEYHQQYLAKNPNGYCGIGGTGVVCPMPSVSSDS